jgi:hypothetical protein
VRVAILNAVYDLLSTEEEATAGWVKLAGADPRCSDEAIKHLIQWTNVKRAGAVLSAGRICPTAKPYSADPNAGS